MQSSVDDTALKGRRGGSDRMSVRFTNPSYVEQAAKPNMPQAVVKVISQARGFRAQKVMEYIARSEGKDGEKELPFEDADGVMGMGREAIAKKYEQWKERFERATPGQKTPPRHVTHMMLSAACENTDQNARKVLAAVREVMQEQLGAKGYDYILVLHRDTDRPHVHIAASNYHRDEDRRKLRLNPPELFEIRTLFAERLQELGIEQAATLRRDRPKTLDQVRRGMAQLKERGTWLQAQMKKAAPTVDALKEREALVKKVARLRQEIKRTTGPLTQERKDHMQALRELSAALVEKGADLPKQVAATIKKLEKEHGQVRSFSQDLQEGSIGPLMGYRQRLQRQRVVDKLTNRALLNIEQAIQVVKGGPLEPADRQSALHQLRALQRGFTRELGVNIRKTI